MRQRPEAENYKVIDLEKGETKTVDIKGVNYAGTDLSSVDSKVSDVTIDGKDKKETIEKTSAQRGTAIAVFDGQKVDLNKCLYTLEAGSGTDTYKVKAMGADGTAIYLGPKASSKSGLPNVTASQPLITFTKNASDDTFSLMDNSTGGAGKYLYFHHTNTAKLHFDRQNTADANCYFEIYTPSDSAEDYDLINGYKKVESTAELKAGGNYLIVTKADANGNRYVLVPSTGTEKYDHVAKLVTETVSSSEQAVLAASDVATFTTENKKAISDNLYTFKKVDENRYIISGHTNDGSTTFLNIGTSRIPNRNVSELIELQSGRNQTVGLYGTTSQRYLYFWYDTSRLYYDRNSTLAALTCEFELYKPSVNAPADSPIPGYELVNGVSGVEDGGEYLITSKVSGNYYIMNPTLESINYRHVAKVSDETYVNPAAEAGSTITFTGVANGSTSVKIGDVIYFVAVREEGIVCDHASTVVVDTKEPTCAEEGYTGDEICTVCDEVIVKGEVITAKGHNYVNGTCTNCGQDDPDLGLTYALRYITVGDQTGWYYANVKGEVDKSYTGVTDNEYGWWYVENGQIDFDYIGLAVNEYGWWYVKHGQADFSYTGLAHNGHGWWYVENGQVDFAYTGTVTWYGTDFNVKNGQVMFGSIRF